MTSYLPIAQMIQLMLTVHRKRALITPITHNIPLLFSPSLLCVWRSQSTRSQMLPATLNKFFFYFYQVFTATGHLSFSRSVSHFHSQKSPVERHNNSCEINFTLFHFSPLSPSLLTSVYLVNRVMKERHFAN